MQKSGIHCFQLVEDLVYGKRFDHGLKQAAKQGGAPELVFEQEPVNEAWQLIVQELAKELEERKAVTAEPQEDDLEPQDEALKSARQPPTSFPLHSAGYWKSVANQTVRTYITVHPEPKTTDGVLSAVAQSSLKDIAGTQGESCVLTFLDLDALGESQGPGMQPLLRKKFNVETALMRKLIQGSMLGRGSQKRENNEATRVVGGDVVVIHGGFGHAGSQKDAKSMFRLTTAKKESETDSDLKEVLVVFDDASIRGRKQRVKGSYSSHASLTFASSVSLTQMLPEKAYSHHPGHSTSNVFHGVRALAPSDLWHCSRSEKVQLLTSERAVAVTAEAQAKTTEPMSNLESVFSASILPVEFFRDLIRAHSCKGFLDLAVGQASAAKACLLERVPFYGFVLSEQHGKKVEMELTEFLLCEMRQEGSSHYRPEAIQEAEESAEKATGGQKNKKEDSETEKQPKKKPRKTSKKTPEGDEVGENPGHQEEEEAGGSPLPW